MASAGTDTYGRVKTVSGTPIVTKFRMLQGLPLYPLQSFYFVGTGPAETTRMPFLVSETYVAIKGIPLATVDRTSVVMAYARGVLGVLAILGFMVIIPGIMHLMGERLDDLAMIATGALLICFFTGTVGGLITYALPLTPRREREIRQYCAELLGVSADPARVERETSASLTKYVDEHYRLADNPRTHLIRQLIATRAMIAQSTDSDRMEAKTDELLERLKHADRITT
jgi:hypothetical protein